MKFSPSIPALFTAACCAASPIFGQEGKPEPVELSEIPATFEEWQDEAGYTWQINKAGAILSGNTPYFQGGLTLFLNGQPFTPTEGVRYDGGQATESGAMLELRMKSDTLPTSRHLFFDAERSGLRVLDVIQNSSNRPQTVRLDYKSGFQYAWQDLHGTEGRLLGTKPGAGLGPRDFGLVVKFSQSDGRHDTMFITSGERDAARPVISFSSNNRELTFSYDLILKPGETAGIVHWVVQRNLRSAADAEAALRPFYSRRRLIRSLVPEKLTGAIVNFDEPSFPGEGAEPFDLDALVNLNEVLEKLRFHRRNEDVLWISAENQLAGTLNPEAKLKVATAFGEKETGIAKVAAIEGGGGIGRKQRVFLRNGEVWAGEITAENLSMKIDEGWDVDEIKPDELGLLLCRISKEDGKSPTEDDLFLELRSADVLAISAKEAAESVLDVLSPWGADEVKFGDLAGLAYTRGSTPKFRLEKLDGSRITVFLNGHPLALPGLETPPNAGDLVRIWRSGDGLKAGQPEELADAWLEFSDIGDPEELPLPACLLAGNNLLVGVLKADQLNLVSRSVTAVNPKDVREIRRSLDEGNDRMPVFEVELKSGDVLSGRIRERMLVIESGGREWQVPVQHFVAYRNGGTEG
ncbi:MAG: hypothetical protein HKN23_04290 [Verrucomicrobiales bacterium]|nr:hypothetical protein [Verrucomicrobiales bacterium]